MVSSYSSNCCLRCAAPGAWFAGKARAIASNVHRAAISVSFWLARPLSDYSRRSPWGDRFGVRPFGDTAALIGLLGPSRSAELRRIAAMMTSAEDAEYGFDQTHDSDHWCCGGGGSRRTAPVRRAGGDGEQVLRKGRCSHLLRGGRFRLPALAASGRRTERDDRLLHRQPAVQRDRGVQ